VQYCRKIKIRAAEKIPFFVPFIWSK